MFTTIFAVVFAAACFVYAAFAFLGKGPLLTTAYLTATPEERRSMKNGYAYRFMGTTFVLAGACILCAGLLSVIGSKWLLFLALGLAVALLVYVCVAWFTVVKKHQ